MDAKVSSGRQPFGRLIVAAELLMAGAMLYVVATRVGDWRAGASYRPLLLSVAILLGILSHLLSAGDMWRREISFPVGRSRVQLALQVVAFICLMAYGVTFDRP